MASDGEQKYEEWPVEDLRIYRPPDGHDKDYRLLYSFAIDGVTTISLECAARLIDRGVEEVTELPE